MVTFSRGGGQFIAGKAADNDDDAACIAGAVAGALHVRTVAELYGVPVILHTDHCCKVRHDSFRWPSHHSSANPRSSSTSPVTTLIHLPHHRNPNTGVAAVVRWHA